MSSAGLGMTLHQERDVKTLQGVMRVMTHVNVGCALGMVAWVVWSGLAVVGGHWQVPQVQRAAPAGAIPEAQPQAPQWRASLQVAAWEGGP